MGCGRVKIVEKSVELVNAPSYKDMLDTVESAARNCYNSRKGDNPETFIRGLIKRGHESPIEFANIVVKITCDRATQNQLVRHRLSSFCVNSLRYIKYDDVPFIKPDGFPDEELFAEMCKDYEYNYSNLLRKGYKPEVARSMLPLCTATTMYMSANVREWRHVLKLRSHKAAQEDIRNIAEAILEIFKDKYPIFFEDI